jgi:putative SOS response-associated peptidase YedK
MYGRVRLSSDYSEIKIKLMFDAAAPAPNFEADRNKPPTVPMLVAIRSEDGKRIPKITRWGLLPHWAKDERLSYSTFNGRSEDFTTKPAFRDAWKRGQRCLVVTDGFYEWKKLTVKDKQPYTNRGDGRHDGDGRLVVAVEGPKVRRRSSELHDPDMRAERPDGRAARSDAGDPA